MALGSRPAFWPPATPITIADWSSTPFPLRYPDSGMLLKIRGIALLLVLQRSMSLSVHLQREHGQPRRFNILLLNVAAFQLSQNSRGHRLLEELYRV